MSIFFMITCKLIIQERHIHRDKIVLSRAWRVGVEEDLFIHSSLWKVEGFSLVINFDDFYMVERNVCPYGSPIRVG